jgi:hypothetical protein
MSTYSYHPEATFEIGQPFHPLKLTNDKSLSGIFEIEQKKVQTEDLAAATTQVTSTYIKNREELYSFFQFDLNFEAKFAFSLKNSFSFERQIDFSSTAIHYAVVATKLYNKEFVQGTVKLTEKGKDIWSKACQSGDIATFQRMAGTEIVTEVNRGSKVILLYSFYFTRSELRESLENKLRASWSTGKITSNLLDELQKIDETTRIEIKAYQTGISKLTPAEARISEAVSLTPDNLPAIQKKIQGFLDNVSEEDRRAAPILTLSTTLISDVPEIAFPETPGISRKYRELVELAALVERRLTRLNGYWADNQKQLEMMTEFDRCWNDVDFIKGSKEKIRRKIRELEDNDDKLFQIFQSCINAETPEEARIDAEPVNHLPISETVSLPYVIPIKWDILHETPRCADPVDQNTRVLTRFAPLVQIKFPQIVDYIYLMLDDIVILKINRGMIQKIVAKDGAFMGVSDITVDNFEFTHGCVPDFTKPAAERIRKKNVNDEENKKYYLQVITRAGTPHRVELSNAKTGMKILPFLTPEQLKALNKKPDLNLF